jgi:AraC-like DNA-binding protein
LQSGLLRRAERRQEVEKSRCPAGIVHLAVPVVLFGRPVGTLLAGKVRLRGAAEAPLDQLVRDLRLPQAVFERLEPLARAYGGLTVFSRAQVAAAARFLGELAQVISMRLPPAPSLAGWREPGLVARAREVIRRHEGGRLTTESVARALRLNPSYFCRAFRRATGLTFHTYLAKVRVEAALSALRNKEQSITAAGFAAGFQSSSDFNRVFKAVLGITPTEFRANALSKSEVG